MSNGCFWPDLSYLKTWKGRRVHNSSPHKWYCHFWDWHNWYLTLLIKLKLIFVNIGTLNYWYWAQFTLTLLKLDISDLQNDWHLQVLIFGIIDISHFSSLELFVFSMSDIKQDWYMAWLTLAYLIFGISGTEHYPKLRASVIIYYWFMMPSNALVLCIYSKITSFRPSEVFFQETIQGSVVPRSIMTNMNYFEYQ